MSMLARDKHDAQTAADRAANHSERANPFTGYPPTVDEIQYRAYRIQLDHGGLYGYDLDNWLHAERELTEARRLRASTKDKKPRCGKMRIPLGDRASRLPLAPHTIWCRQERRAA
jgi:hypothetical protein